MTRQASLFDRLEKKCSCCKKVKDPGAFGADPRNRSGLSSRCLACQKAAKSTPEAKARDKVTAKAWREKNKDRERDKVRRWRKANPDARRAQAQRNHERHRNERNAASRERTKTHYREHPETFKAHGHTRRARKRSAGGSFTAADWKWLKATCGSTCLCCGRAEPEIKLTLDHVVPLARGGRNDLSNLQPLCLTCNLRKRTKGTDYRTAQVRALVAARINPAGDEPTGDVLLPKVFADGTEQPLLPVFRPTSVEGQQ